MSESVLLVLFGALPVACVAGLWLFFRKFKLHQKQTYRGAWLLAGNLLVLLALFSVGLLGGEIYYRWIYDASDSFGLTKTNQSWFDRHFHKNASGFRDTVPRYEPKNTSGKKRLVILGDSFTAGQGIAQVEDTLGFLLRKKLPDWEVRIHAECGWDTGNEGGELERMASEGYQVDAVLLAYCLNDISQSVPEWGAKIRQLRSDQTQAGFLVKNSYLVNFAYYRLYASLHPDLANYFAFLRDAYESEPWKEQSEVLQLMNYWATKKLNAKFLVVTLPLFSSLGPDYPFQQAHGQLDHLWTQLHVPHLDLLPTFQRYRSDELVAGRFDAHPNERAIAIASDELSDFLTRNLQPAPGASVE